MEGIVKFVVFLLAIIALLAAIAAIVTVSGRDTYDVNCDGKVNSYDLHYMYRVQQGDTATDQLIRRCDINSDGLVNQDDLDMLMDRIMRRDE